jgi:hypothetical protein
MCLAVYIGSSLPLEEGSWDKKNQKFYLERAAEAEPPGRHFSGKFVYYAGSHEGCGCGFSKDGEPPEELIKCQENYDALARVLEEALEKGAKLQLFTCWEGDQAEEPESVQSITPQRVREPAYELQELELRHVERSDA